MWNLRSPVRIPGSKLCSGRRPGYTLPDVVRPRQLRFVQWNESRRASSRWLIAGVARVGRTLRPVNRELVSTFRRDRDGSSRYRSRSLSCGPSRDRQFRSRASESDVSRVALEDHSQRRLAVAATTGTASRRRQYRSNAIGRSLRTLGGERFRMARPRFERHCHAHFARSRSDPTSGCRPNLDGILEHNCPGAFGPRSRGGTEDHRDGRPSGEKPRTPPTATAIGRQLMSSGWLERSDILAVLIIRNRNGILFNPRFIR